MTIPSGRSPHAVAAGTILVVLGAVWAMVGVVLLALAWLSAGGSSLPAWVSGAAAGGSAALTGLVGLLIVAAGAGQVLCGVPVATGRAGTAAMTGGLLLSAVGVAFVTIWFLAAIAQQRPSWILVPPLLAYLYAAWDLAFKGHHSPRG